MTTSFRLLLAHALRAFCLSSALLVAAAAFAEEARRNFDIPAGQAEQTLAQFASQSGTQFFFTAETVSGQRTHAAQGSLTPREALDRMLARTELVAVQDRSTGAYSVRRALTVGEAEKNGASRPVSDRAAVNPSDDEVYVLNPFQVDASEDSRYRAASTLGGSRLNTPLKDVAAVIDVYTKDFMLDIGATNLEDVLSYGNNMERDTEDTVHGQGTLNISTGNSFRYRIRGLPASRARNYFDFDYPIDTYNTERLDESRGPNSILFGFGSPGGIVNSSTKKPILSRNRTEVSYQVGSEIDNRAELDFNQVLVKNRAALRLNALHQEETGWRKYTFDDIDAFTLAVSARPFAKTLVNVEYERYLENDSVARPTTYWTQTDTWDAAGKQLINTNFANRTNATLNPGLNSTAIAQLASTNYWVFTEQGGQLLNWRGMSRSNRASYTAANGTTYTAIGDFRDMRTTPEGILEVNTMGPSTGRNLELDTFYASIQQEVTKDLHLEFALTQQYSDWKSRRLAVNSATLFADPNRYLPQGGATSTGPATTPVANPYAGQYYFETPPQYWRTRAATLNYRATASYELPYERFGKHRFAFLYEHDDYDIKTATLQEQVLVNGALASTAAANAANNLNRRFYILDTSNANNYRNASVVNPPPSLDATLADGTRVTSRLFQYTSAPADYTKVNDVLMLVAQSSFWRNRINTIVGIRRDDVSFDDWGSYVADGQGGYTRSLANRSVVDYKGNTRNYGVVFNVKDWLSVFANYSTSVGVPGLKIIYAPNGAFMDPMEGEGRDYGIKFSIPNRRIQGSLSYFEASSKNETDNQNVEGWGVNGSNSFLDGLVGAGFMTEAQATPLRSTGTGDTIDSESKGVEFSVTGELVRNWEMRFNYSYTDRSLSNAFPRVNAWAEKTLRPFWATWDRDNPNTPAVDNILDTVSSGGNTLRTYIQNFETNLATRTISRSRVTGLRPHKANLFTTYAFKEGRFSGLRVGGGVRYEAPNYAGTNTDGSVYEGRSFTAVDLMAAYTRSLFKKPVTLQLNVRDAFREDPWYGPSVINASGNWDTLVIQPPRQFTFTVRVAL